MAFTMESSVCAFDILLAENDDEDTVKADRVIVDDNYEAFIDFVKRVNICISEFDQKLRGLVEREIRFFELFGFN